MTRVRVRGFQIFTDRHGKKRCYHRKTRIPVDLATHPLGSVEFFAECARIAALADRGQTAKPGTLGLLVQRYREDVAFTDLADRTRADYQRVFDYLKPIADMQLSWFTPARIVRIRDKAGKDKGRRFGTYVKQVLSTVFGWGVERGYLAANPAFKVKSIRKPRNAPAANRPWTDGERYAVMDAAPQHLRLPLALMMFTGMDPQDALNLPRSAIADGEILVRRGKTGAESRLPIVADLARILAESDLPDVGPVCLNSKGRRWTRDGFHASWRKLRVQLEQDGKVSPGLTPKGLRHTVATILAEMGEDERSIADTLGHSTTEMARHYSRRADKTRKLSEIMSRFEAEANRRRTKVVKPT